MVAMKWMVLIGGFICCASLTVFAQEVNLKQARENIRKTLEIETEQIAKEETWANEKARLLNEIQLLRQQKADLQSQNKIIEESVQKLKKAQQADVDEQKGVQAQHQDLLKNIKNSVADLNSEQVKIPNDENLRLMLKTMVHEVSQEQFNPVLVFNELIDFHQQWWQLSQSYQIRSGTVMIEDKEYYGEIIRLGLVYQFLLFADQKHFAYYDTVAQQWKFGKPEETSKIVKIKNVLSKSEPAQVIHLPSK